MRYSTLLLFIFWALSSAAQSSTARVKFDKSTLTGLMLPVPFNEEVAEGTILKKLKETGFNPESKGSLFWKQDKVHDFYVFKGVELNGMNGEKLDLYFKVEQSGKKSAEQSHIYLLINKPGQNFIDNESHPGVFSVAKTFLDNFTSETANYKHDLDVKAQEEKISQADKKLAKLVDEAQDMTKKIERLQNDLKKNQQEQEDLKRQLEEERRKLEDLRLKKGV